MHQIHRSTLPIIAPILACTMIGLFTSNVQARNPPRGPDFNRDGYDDMAIGIPNESDVASDAGGVNILYGSSSGPDAPNMVTLYFDQDSTNVPDTAQSGDHFGRSLAWGDFDGDGYDDLIIGVPGEDILTLTDAGLVNVLYGGLGHLSGTGAQSISGGFGATAYSAAASDQFGLVVAAGDFNGDGYDDAAVSANGYDDGATSGVGAVVILYGTVNGLSTDNELLLHQDYSGMAGDGNQASDAWGTALVTGDFDCDGYDDLAIGARDEEISGISGLSHGAVTVVYGGNTGLTTTGSQWWHQEVTDFEDTAEGGDGFGSSLAAANFDGDTSSSRDCVDLAIGVPVESISGNTANGAVSILYGSSGSGLTVTGDQLLYQGNGLAGSLAANGQIGSSLTVGRFNYGTYDDLAVGANEADPGGNASAGEVYLVKGSVTGLTSSGGERWDQLTTGVPGTREASDNFGWGLSYAESEGVSGAHYLFFGAVGEDSDQGAVGSSKLDSANADFESLSGIEWKQDDIEGTPANNEDFGYSMPAPRLKERPIS